MKRRNIGKGAVVLNTPMDFTSQDIKPNETPQKPQLKASVNSYQINYVRSEADFSNVLSNVQEADNERKQEAKRFQNILQQSHFKEKLSSEDPLLGIKKSSHPQPVVKFAIESNQDYSDQEYSEPEVSPKDQIVDFFQSLKEQIGPDNDSEIKKTDSEIQIAKQQYQQILTEISKMESTFNGTANENLWKQKRFFTEMIDFIDHIGVINPADVRPEYSDLDNILEQIRNLRRLDNTLYVQSGLPSSVEEIFEFYAAMDTCTFNFKDNIPLLDLNWIRAGWKWLDEDGDSDIVPKIFEKTAFPILLESLRQDDFESEQDWHIAWLHCYEITEYCIHPDAIEFQLRNVMKKKLESAYGTSKLSQQLYNKLLVEFGMKKPSFMESLMIQKQ